ncbi:MAG: GTPase [Cyanobacteria bacterium P01_H01_bin.35]
MFFRIKEPSISAIRAKFILQKLQELPATNNTINICATGRTGSGKTTLGNRLIGIDYFMPSTGIQDCTDEINLIAFPSGIKYFDTPGVGSDETLENYNRAALGVKQVESIFSPIQTLTLATYSQEGRGKNLDKKHFDVADFKGELIPDLIFYMIAAHQQFLNADCIYLRDLLVCYPHQVVYVLNIFADKETGTFSYATEQNIIDVVRKIKKVHHHVLASNQQPTIVPINCWTGEGISDLLTQSYEILGSEKGKQFKQLIQYQQQNTPDEYVNQVQKELLKLFAYACCQKPEGTYSCNQSLHQNCYSLLHFISELRNKSQQPSYQLGTRINTLIQEILEAPLQTRELETNSFFDDVESLNNTLTTIQSGIDSLNDKINNHLTPYQQQALEFRDQQVEKIKQEIIAQSEIINNLKSELEYDVKQRDMIREEIQSISNDLEERSNKINSLVDEYNSLNKNVNKRISRFNYSLESVQSLAVKINQRMDNYNSRRSKLNSRIASWNSSMERLNANPYARVSQSTIDSLKAESNSIDRESLSLKSEEISLQQMIKERDNKIREIEIEEISLNLDISKRDKLRDKIESKENSIQKVQRKGISKVNLLEDKSNEIQAQIKEYSKKRKLIEEYVNFYQEILNEFEQEFSEIEQEVEDRRQNINSGLEAIVLHLRESNEAEGVKQIKDFQNQINNCLEDMRKFNDEISVCQEKLKKCVNNLAINKLIMQLLIDSTVHHFDNVGSCEYKGSSYNYFGQKALILLLSLAHLSISGKSIDIEYKDWSINFAKIVNNISGFPNIQELTERRVISILETQLNSLFFRDFNQMLRQVAM